MANPFKGEALVHVGAGEFTLAYTLGACAAIEGQFDGKPLNDVLASLQTDGGQPPARTMQIVIWAGLKKHHQMSIDEVGDLISIHEMDRWSDGLIRAFSLAQPEGAPKGNPRKAKVG